MAVTVSGKNFTQISGCESTSDGGTWLVFDTQDGDVVKEGTYSLCGTFKTSGNNDGTFTPSSAVDLSGTKHVRFWILSTHGGLLNVASSGGIQFFASDGSNTGYWYVGGKDTYPGGWWNAVVDVSRAVDSGTKPTSMNAITSMGIRINLTGVGKNIDNLWIDNLCVCDGLIAYGDDGGGNFDFSDIYSIENTPSTGGYGILTKIGGVYFSTGVLEMGDSSGSNNCYFNDQSNVLVFEQREVSTSNNINTSLMGISIVDNGTGETRFVLGAKAGTAGISGDTIRVQNTSQTSKFYIDGDNTNVDYFKIYGCSILDAGAINFPANATNVEILSSNFESCGDIYINTAIVKYSNIISANDAGCVISSTSHNFSDNKLINCGHGIDFPTANTFGLTNCNFINNTYDIEFSAASGDLIINATNSDPSTYEITGSGSSVTINISADIDIEVVTEDDVAIENARVFIEADSDGSYPSYKSVTSITRVSDTATVSCTGHGLYNQQYAIIRGANQQEYNGIHQITYIDANSFSYTVSGTPDTPATGTITLTMRMMQELTTALGIASESIKYVGSQPIQGWIRKCTSTPIYKETTISGTFTADGFSGKYMLVLDE